ncbi:MAG TPA: hypothetical protein VEX41_01345 [Candidatus Eisenbacteria bacterium]|nr:hypothetical protein [Candidatus Eisenbacteria bacterium]
MAMLQSRLTRAEWGLALWWVVATTAGWLVGFAVCEAFSAFLRSLSGDGAIIGTGVGIAQWLVLRRQFSGARWWILASVIGFGIGKVLGDQLAAAVGGPVGIALGGATIGVAAGLLQWIVLRREVAAPGWWVLASTIGWAVAWMIIGTIEDGAAGPSGSAYLIGVAGAALAGVITGATLVWLLRTRTAARP